MPRMRKAWQALRRNSCQIDFGVASLATVHAVKIFSDSSSGSLSRSCSALHWTVNTQRQAVASMSLDARGLHERFMDAVQPASNAGVVVVVAAGS